jgi:uncharacterized lipoprotein YddW (UPF0748 family)
MPSPRFIRCTAAALFASTAGASGQLAAPELRATWLTTTASDDLSVSQLPTTFGRLRDAGLNTVYVESLKNGYTNFDSPTLDALLGGFEGAGTNPLIGGRDLLAESSAAAADEGLVNIAWMEYGLAAQFGSAALAPRGLGRVAFQNGWLLEDQNGNLTNSSNGFSWMNPAIPEVRQLIVDLAVEAASVPGVHGVQFDDRLAWPSQFGFDQTTLDLYQAETGFGAPTSTSDAFFTAWRSSKVDLLAREISQAVRDAQPDDVVSLTPSVFPFSFNQYLADWTDWVDQGLFDEYVPQVYRLTSSDFDRDWATQLASVSDDSRLGAGLRILGSGADTPLADILQMLDQLESDNAYGHSFWYSDGLTDAGGYLDAIASYYDIESNGFAPNPLVTIPEPTTLALAAVGGFVLLRRRNQ